MPKQLEREAARIEAERDFMLAARKAKRAGLTLLDLWAVFGSVDEVLRSEARLALGLGPKGPDDPAWAAECRALANEDGC